MALLKGASPPLGPLSSPPGLSTGTFRPPPPPTIMVANSSMGSDEIISSAGRGGANGKSPTTDPAKFKTAICRNWEQQGTCAFKNCAFAHGPDELRGASRTSPSVPAPSAIGAATNSGHLSQCELILELITTEVHRERENYLLQQDANKTLEVLLRKEQQVKQEDAKVVERLEKQVQTLLERIAARDAEIMTLRGGTSPLQVPQHLQSPPALPVPTNTPSTRCAPLDSSDDRVMSILSALAFSPAKPSSHETSQA